jgi:hypothetical protein
MHYLLKIREEIKKLASGHISHSAALRLGKSALFLRFFEKSCGKRPHTAPAAFKPDTASSPAALFPFGSFASRLRRE